MKPLIATIGLSLFCLVIPSTLFAVELKYTTILNSNDEQILFRVGGLSETEVYICNVTNLSCRNLGQNIPSDISEKFTEAKPQSEKIKTINFDRKNATRLLLSPDERWFAYYDAALANKEKTRKFVLLNIDPKSKNYRNELVGKVNYWDLLSEELRLFNFSPDSKKFAYLDDKSGYSTVYIVDLTKTAKNYLPGTPITTKKYSVSDFLLWDDNTLYFVANRESSHNWSLYRLKLKTKDLEKIADNVSYNQQMKIVGDNLLFIQIINNSTVPKLYNPQTKKISSFPDISANPKMTDYQEKEIKLGKLSGVLLKPANYSSSKRLPLIVWLHGGPYRQTALGYHSYLGYAVYDWLLGEMARSGTLVLKLDYHGSYGYGRSFAEDIKGNVGKIDVADVLSAVTELKNNYKVSKTYLVGNSYGGYLALRTIVDKPKSFAGAMSINGVTDWFVLLDQLENSIFNVQFGGLLEEKNSDAYWQADIADKVKNLSGQKIIIAQSASDRTVPPSQADYITKIFGLKNKPLDLVKYPGEDHVFKKPSSLEDICQRLAKMASLQANCLWEQ